MWPEEWSFSFWLMVVQVEAVHRPGYVSRVRGLSSLPAQRLPLHNPQDQATQTVHTYFWARSVACGGTIHTKKIHKIEHGF
jgi:hypothetical protein